MYDQLKDYQQWEDSFREAGGAMKAVIERLANLDAENYRVFRLLRKVEKFLQADNRYLMTDLQQEIMQALHRQPEPPSAECDASQLARLQAEIKRLRAIVCQFGHHVCKPEYYLPIETMEAIIQIMAEENQKAKENDKTQND